MSKLEDLVPPLELCYKLRIGDFAESVFVWNVRCSPDKIQLIPRSAWDHGGYICSAPTLTEIMDKLYEQYDFVGAKLKDGVCQVGCFRNDEDAAKVVVHATNMSTAALKLWLEVNK